MQGWACSCEIRSNPYWLTNHGYYDTVIMTSLFLKGGFWVLLNLFIFSPKNCNTVIWHSTHLERDLSVFEGQKDFCSISYTSWQFDLMNFHLIKECTHMYDCNQWNVITVNRTIMALKLLFMNFLRLYESIMYSPANPSELLWTIYRFKLISE